jgi:cytochrome c
MRSVQWITVFGTMALAGATMGPSLAADPTADEKIFKSKCVACHTV